MFAGISSNEGLARLLEGSVAATCLANCGWSQGRRTRGAGPRCGVPKKPIGPQNCEPNLSVMQATHDPPPRSAGETVLSAVANIVGAVALWGTLWNVLLKGVLGRVIKPCKTSLDVPPDKDFPSLPDYSRATTTTSCPPVPEVPWNLIIASLIMLLLLALAWWGLWGRQMLRSSVPATDMSDGRRGAPHKGGSASAADRALVKPTARTRPPATGTPKASEPPSSTQAASDNRAVSPSSSAAVLGSFLGDPKFSGLMSLVGVLVALVQLFR